VTEAPVVRILDSHCHAWRRWPYLPPVPDEASRGTADQLLYELDTNGVEQALVVCAAIEKNPDNIEYVASARDLHPTRLRLVADLDCTWSTTYHAPGSAGRLLELDDRYRLAGFAHYLAEENDGWLLSGDADELFAAAAERHLIVSLGATTNWQADLRSLARRHPGVPILCQTLGGVRAEEGLDSPGLADLLSSRDVPNIYIKVAGFHYASARGWDYPWTDAIAVLARIFEAFGPERLCFGSDFPASTRFCTFRQALAAVQGHCSFFSPQDLALVLGGTLARLLEAHDAGR
jgi:L-fuconolactonase